MGRFDGIQMHIDWSIQSQTIQERGAQFGTSEFVDEVNEDENSSDETTSVSLIRFNERCHKPTVFRESFVYSIRHR